MALPWSLVLLDVTMLGVIGLYLRAWQQAHRTGYVIAAALLGVLTLIAHVSLVPGYRDGPLVGLPVAALYVVALLGRRLLPPVALFQGRTARVVLTVVGTAVAVTVAGVGIAVLAARH